MSQNKYWQGFSDVNDPETREKRVVDEFHEELPFEGFDSKGLADAKAPRRDFLKYLGFSTAAAAIAAGCKTPVKKAIPFANKPENIVPGEAKYYATTYIQDGDVVPVLARVRDGRPILLEGNDLSFAKGCTTARIQASVLDLYDIYRTTHPKQKEGDDFKEIPSYEDADKLVGAALAGLNGAPVVLLTGTVNSPSTRKLIGEFLQKFPGSRHVQYDADSYSGILSANETSFGKKAIPSYQFEKAEVIVSLGADFLGTWISPVEYQHGYALNRKIDEKNPKMSKHYQFESFLSMTGANADERFTHRASEVGAVALALAAALGIGVSAPGLSNEKLKKGIEKVAADLKANNGKAVVVSGSNDKNVQLIVNAINNAIGAYGATINWGAPVSYRQGVDKDFADLVSQMESGQVGALLIHGANPAYTWPQADKFKAALGKVKLTVSFNEKLDETTELCRFILPNPHYLESWGDAEAKPGLTGFLQPTIYPLFKTRPYQTSLLKWSGNDADYETYFRNYWTGRLGDEAFTRALQNGVLAEGETAVSGGSYSSGDLSTAVAALASVKATDGYEVELYKSVSLGVGTHPGNPWLQELPDPITKATWDNYAMISLSAAKELLDLDLINGSEKEKNNYEYYPKKPVIKITVNGVSKELPVLVIPGMDSKTIAVALGYGRSGKLGKSVENVGVDVTSFTSFDGTSVNLVATGAAVEDAGRSYKIAQTQIHNSYEGRLEVVRETTLATFKKTPNEIKDYRDNLVKTFAKQTGNFRKEATLYGDHTQEGGIKWGMNIDMNACVGCGACIIACHAENNVPVVGKSEVLRYHDMHWLRIDRYFVSDENNPDELKGVVFQPMMCQHCDNAPCENVCPVAATNHSVEGLNQMTYNRCIGTRYCANNCPYKVRRFNWSDYTGADSFPNNQDQKLVGKLDVVVHEMNEDLTRMVLNPDVTVRSRGVIEKCSFCVQRLQAAKLDAKKKGEPLKDKHLKLACSSACAADAITFGNIRDEESRISIERNENPQRLFYVLEQLHVLPNISYLAKIRNTDEIIESHHGHGAAEEHKEEKQGEGNHH